MAHTQLLAAGSEHAKQTLHSYRIQITCGSVVAFLLWNSKSNNLSSDVVQQNTIAADDHSAGIG